MRGLAKKLKRQIVMLLVCALVAGSVPVNAFAAEIDNEPVVTDEITTDVAVSDGDDTEQSAMEVAEDEDVSSEENKTDETDVTVVEDAAVEETVSGAEKEAADVQETEDGGVSQNDTPESEITKEDSVSGNDGSEQDVQASVSNSDSINVANSENIGGTIGDVSWSIDAEGKLTVSGEGNIDSNPWLTYADQIKSAKLTLSGMESLANFFNGCTNLETVDLSGVDASELKTINSMFYCCSSLKEIDLSDLDLQSVTEASDFLIGCDSLECIMTPTNVTCGDIALPSAAMNYPALYWYEVQTENQYTVLPQDTEDSITLLRREKGFGKDISLTLDKSGYGSEIDLTFSGAKENAKQYTYNINYYYNDKVREGYSVVSFTDETYTTISTVDVSDCFGGEVSGEVTVYAKAFIDGYEMATSNSITITIADTKLDSVKNIKVNGSTVSWDPVVGAVGYHVQLSKKTGETSYTGISGANFWNIKETTLDFSEFSDVALIQIRALSGDCASKLHSDMERYVIGSSEPTTEETTYTFTGTDGTYLFDNGVYSIIAGAEYRARLSQGSSKVNATDATLYDGKNPYIWKSAFVVEGYYDEYEPGDVELDMNSVSFNSTTPKNMELRITSEEDNVTKIPLRVYPGIKSVTVTGVSNGKATQEYNSTKEYALKTSPVNMVNIFDTIGLKIMDESGVVETAEISNGKLIIQTSSRNGKVDVKLYDKVESRIYEDEPEWSYYEYIKGGEFTLEVTGPGFTNVKPTVALQSATNTELTLKVGATGIEEPTEGKLWYEVTTELVDKADAKSDVYETVTEYYPYNESQVVTIAVADVENDGKFPAVKNNIQVSVVQTIDETDPNEGGEILFRTNASKVAVLKNVSTKAATYETKLKLKKGTTQLFTGQEDVVVATPQFSKTTYFKGLNLLLQTPNGMIYDAQEADSNNIGITFEYNEAEEKIFVSVDDQARIGKYNIIATVATPTGIKAVSANMAFEVVYGINTIWFQNLPSNIYKVAGKAATISVEYIAQHYVEAYVNEYGNQQGSYNTNPFKNSVKLSLVGENGEELSDSLKAALSINKGKITVNKDYVPSNERFCIKAEATDYKGNKMTPVVSYSIGISGYTPEMGEIVLGRWNPGDENSYEDDGFNVVKYVEETKELSIDEVRGLTFAVLKKDVDKGDNFYSLYESEVIGSGVKFTTSNKNLELSSDGYIQGLTKAANNVTITATMVDGSGTNVAVKGLKVTGTAQDIDVRVLGGELTGSPVLLINTLDPNFDRNECSYNGVLNKTVLQVQVGGNGSLYGKGANYSVAISGAKTLSKHSSGDMQYYDLEPNKEVVTITIDNKNTGEKDVYKLTNANSQTVTDLGTVKVEGSFVQYSQTPDSVTLKLPDGYEGNYVKLYTDNSKMMKDGKYITFVYNGIDLSPVEISEDNTVQIPLRDGVYPYYSGDFKLAACVGTMENDEFTPITTCKDVTFKVASAKVGKVKTSYNLNIKDTDAVELTTNVKGSEVYSIDSIENINSKGVPNRFTDYFEIDGTTLKLKDDIDADMLQKLYSGKAKDDLKGWITCTVKTGDFEQPQAVQVTINAKNVATAKYAASNVTIAEGDNWTIVSVNKTANKITEKANVQHVTADKYIDAMIYYDNDIEIYTGSSRQFAPGKTTSVTLYAVDEDAPEAVKNILDEYKNAYEQNYNYELEQAYNNLIKVFGNKVTSKVTVVKSADITKKDKVKLDVKSISLTDKNLDNEFNYTAEIGYIELIEDLRVNEYSSPSVEVKFGTNDVTDEFTDYITVDTNNKKIIISIPQNELCDLVEDEIVSWKKTISVNIKFEVQDYINVETYEEIDTLKITLPSKPKSFG